MFLTREQLAALYALRKAGECFEIEECFGGSVMIAVFDTDKVWTVSPEGRSERVVVAR